MVTLGVGVTLLLLYARWAPLPIHAPEVALDTIGARSDSGGGHKAAGE